MKNKIHIKKTIWVPAHQVYVEAPEYYRVEYSEEDIKKDNMCEYIKLEVDVEIDTLDEYSFLHQAINEEE